MLSVVILSVDLLCGYMLNVVMLNVAAPFFIRFALIAAKRKKNEIFCRFLLTLNASIESDGASTKIHSF
jgi:hypothetical protein